MFTKKDFKIVILTILCGSINSHFMLASNRKAKSYYTNPTPSTMTDQTQNYSTPLPPAAVCTQQKIPSPKSTQPEPKILTPTKDTQQCFREDSSPDHEKTACSAAPLPDNGLNLDQPTIQNFAQALKEQDPSFNDKEYDIVTDAIPEESSSFLSWVSAPVEIYNKHIANFWETHVAPFPDRVAIAIHSGVTTYRHFVITQISQKTFDPFLEKIQKSEDRMIWIRSALNESIDSNIESDVITILEATEKRLHQDFGVSLQVKLKKFFADKTQDQAQLLYEDYIEKLRSIRRTAGYYAMITSNATARPTSPELETIAITATQQAVLTISNKSLTYHHKK
ncbi:hypothetical protein KBD08_03710 [Candidatus Babeliales bacterium]|nr:hypothetical protein [Candidatus Babeliales bacterium]